MYEVMVRPDLDKVFEKLSRRDHKQMLIIDKKVGEIRENPHRYKNLKKPLQDFKRVHIGHFVLLFSVDEKNKMVILENFKHHDEIYR
ncbi:MAG: type II toxin-antitoxin system RelE/ParE family toxin [Candidatus Woesearchaeota archaeon]